MFNALLNTLNTSNVILIMQFATLSALLVSGLFTWRRRKERKMLTSQVCSLQTPCKVLCKHNWHLLMGGSLMEHKCMSAEVGGLPLETDVYLKRQSVWFTCASGLCRDPVHPTPAKWKSLNRAVTALDLRFSDTVGFYFWSLWMTEQATLFDTNELIKIISLFFG